MILPLQCEGDFRYIDYYNPLKKHLYPFVAGDWRAHSDVKQHKIHYLRFLFRLQTTLWGFVFCFFNLLKDGSILITRLLIPRDFSHQGIIIYIR